MIKIEVLIYQSKVNISKFVSSGTHNLIPEIRKMLVIGLYEDESSLRNSAP